MELKAKEFWNRLDKRLPEKMSLKVFCSETNTVYRTITQQRTRETLPDIKDICAFSSYLGISLDELVYGKTSAVPVYPPRVQAIADKLMKVSPVDLDSVERMVTLMSEEKRIMSSVQSAT